VAVTAQRKGVAKSIFQQMHAGQMSDETPAPVSKRCEDVLSLLGEGEVRPLSVPEMKAFRDRAIAGFPDIKINVFKPVPLGGRELDWIGMDSGVDLSFLKGAVPKNEVTFLSNLERVAAMGVTLLGKETLIQASWDVECLKGAPEGPAASSYLAARLTSLDDYPSRKAYALALGLMELRNKRGESG
jgi:hypothetical protein